MSTSYPTWIVSWKSKLENLTEKYVKWHFFYPFFTIIGTPIVYLILVIVSLIVFDLLSIQPGSDRAHRFLDTWNIVSAIVCLVTFVVLCIVFGSKVKNFLRTETSSFAKELLHSQQAQDTDPKAVARMLVAAWAGSVSSIPYINNNSSSKPLFNVLRTILQFDDIHYKKLLAYLRADFAHEFRKLMSLHLDRMRQVGTVVANFIDQQLNADVLADLASPVEHQMGLTQMDGKEHIVTRIRGKTYYTILTLRTTLEKAPDWFVRHHGGYTKVLEAAWNSDEYIREGCVVLCHITYAIAEGLLEDIGWVDVSILPTQASLPGVVPILARDLLSRKEKRDMEKGNRG